MNKQILTKSDFLNYLDAPMHLWATTNGYIEKDKTQFDLHLIEQGYEVENLAKQFLELYISNNHESSELLWQKTYCDKNYQVKIDALIYDSILQSYDLYEIKSSTNIEDEKLADVTFQFLVLQDQLPINKVYILHLNKDYERNNALDIRQLFIADDVTEKVHNLKLEIETKRNTALDIIQRDSAEGIMACCAPKECPCLTLCHPDLPEFSIYHIPRLNKTKANTLRANNILAAKDIPHNFKLSEKQNVIVSAAKSGNPILNIEELKNELTNLIFPLYFLDYESYNSAIPLFSGYRPQQQIVFQYSLHVLECHDATIQHYEYLALHKQDPAPGLIESLKQNIRATGSIIVWNKTFEASRHKEMALRYPDNADFLNNLNDRIYDLSTPITEGIYVHPGFKGSWSIKNVLPVLAPHLTYKTLNVQKGDEAMSIWWQLTHGNINSELSQAQKALSQSLLEYCKLDTWAMVAIWNKFNELCF